MVVNIFKYLISADLPQRQLNYPLSMRERARVRGKSRKILHSYSPHPAFGHLLPQGEGNWEINSNQA